MAHVENVSWVSKGDIKTLKQTKGKKVAVTIPSVSWVDFDTANKADSKPSKLGGITTDKNKEQITAFKARLAVTDSLEVIRAHQAQHDAISALLSAKLEKLAPTLKKVG